MDMWWIGCTSSCWCWGVVSSKCGSWWAFAIVKFNIIVIWCCRKHCCKGTFFFLYWKLILWNNVQIKSITLWWL
jgi:hypothetical protein